MKMLEKCLIVCISTLVPCTNLKERSILWMSSSLLFKVRSNLNFLELNQTFKD